MQKIGALVTVELKKVYRDPITLDVLMLIPVGLALMVYLALGNVANANDYYPAPGMTHFEYLLPGAMGYSVIYMRMMVALALSTTARLACRNGSRPPRFPQRNMWEALSLPTCSLLCSRV